MFIKKRQANVIHLQLTVPRYENDEAEFLQFLQDLVKQEDKKIIIVMEVAGEARFTPKGKRQLTRWFRQEKLWLRGHCQALIRLTADEKKHSPLKNRLLALALPCPYYVFFTQEEVNHFLQKVQTEEFANEIPTHNDPCEQFGRID